MYSGAAFLLKLSDGSKPPSFSTRAGMRLTKMSISNKPVATRGSENWQELEAGASALSIEAKGIILNAEGEGMLRNRALSGNLDEYVLTFEDGYTFRGHFLIVRFDYVGDFNGERNYTIALESSSKINVFNGRTTHA
jgi:predicted secreted protein